MKKLVLILAVFCNWAFADSFTSQHNNPEQAVLHYRQGLQRVVQFVQNHNQKIESPAERQQVQEVWFSFSQYMGALEMIAREHADFIHQPARLQRQAFYLHLSASLAVYIAATDLIELVDANPSLSALLAESSSDFQLGDQAYQRLRSHYLSIATLSRVMALTVVQRTSITKSPAELKDPINADIQSVWSKSRGRGIRLTGSHALNLVKNTHYPIWFPLEKGAFKLAGSVKTLNNNKSAISSRQLKTVAQSLVPGDIILTRREWRLDNVGLPGYWPHTGLYVGDKKQLDEYFHDDQVIAWVKSSGVPSGRFLDLLSRFGDTWKLYTDSGGHFRMVEAMEQGVGFTAVGASLKVDSLAVLRPNLNKLEKAKAILNVFNFVGSPYDYQFDFLTDSELLCSELIFKAYQPSMSQQGLKLPLRQFLGRTIMTPNEIARTFAKELKQPSQQLQLIWFLDGGGRSQANEGDALAFAGTWQRPKWHLLTGTP